jgi:hypothetical protein
MRCQGRLGCKSEWMSIVATGCVCTGDLLVLAETLQSSNGESPRCGVQHIDWYERVRVEGIRFSWRLALVLLITD